VAKNRKTEKAVEIHEFYVVRTNSGSLPALCDECVEGNAFMVPPEQAALVTHVPLRMIYSWIERALVHFRETPNGSLIVCLRSLTVTRNRITDDDSESNQNRNHVELEKET
jgi:hypothetical protein